MQSNHEGVLIDLLQTAGEDHAGVILNAGALTHYSYALRDAVACCTVPVAEVHMSDITAREEFRRNDVLSDVCTLTVMGLGEQSYFKALDMMIDLLKN
jgi:3-dehydroquinate dehydratase-2